MNNVIESFLEFKTEENLPENWVKTVWMNIGFTSYFPFPAEYDVFLEEVNIADLLNNFYESMKNWFRLSGMPLKDIIINYSNMDVGNSQDCDMNWQNLISEGIDCKALICIIGTIILRFLEEPTNSSYFNEALLAIRLYLYFVAIPGSHVCQIFNSTLYSHVMSVIRLSCEQIDGCAAKSKGVKRKKGDNEDDMEADDSESNRLTYDKFQLISLTNDFLTNLKLIIENKKLRLDETSLNLTIQILMMITRLEKVYSSLLVNSSNNFRKDSVSYLAFKSFNILLSMSSLLHSNPSESAKLIIKSMLPIFLINELRTLGLALKDASVVRTNCTLFLKMLLDELGENAYDAVNILVQRICVAVPDRAEMRMKASNIVLDILKISPPDLLAEEIYSIVFMSHMSETKIRMFTLEIISKLLMETETNISFSRLPQKYAAITNDEFLLAVIFYRCQDVSASIRTKSLSYLDQFISCAMVNRRAKKVVEKIFVDPYAHVKNPETLPEYTKPIFDTQQFLLEERFLDDRSLNPLPGIKVVLDMLVYFSQEDKVFIKKCAIQTLARILLFSKLWIKKELLEVFLLGCDDNSVLVRKTMSQILTDLIMMYPDNSDVIKCWVEGVVPMIAEEEIKAQEKIVEHFCKVILNNIMMYNHTTSIVSRLPWSIMKEILAQDKRSYLHFAVGKWIQNKNVKSKTIQTIYSHIDTENNIVAWCLLVSFSQFMDLPNSDLIFEYYQSIRSTLHIVEHSQLVLETLYYVCPNLSKEVKRDLLNELEINLVDCSLPLKLTARARDICELILSNLNGNKKNTHSIVMDWSAPKITVCVDYIESQIGKSAPIEIENVEKLMKYIFLLGELVQAAPNCVTKSNIRMLENILLSPRKRESDAWKGRACNALKAITILTLVKLVLQKEETANSIMPIFREILSSNSVDPTIQVNTIIGMCDLCSRYTTLVERYFTYICKCFNSKDENVRITALISVMKRVKEEYVKLRPFILYPMLTMIMDDSVAIKRTIATFIGVDLKKKNNILESFYTGLFFFLNNFKEHSTTVKIPDDIRTIFSLTDKPEQREYIYIYVLDKLADTNKRLLLCKKIVNEVMGSVADGSLKLDEKMESILIDAFNVLVDNEKKISEAITRSKRGSNEEVEDIEDPSEPKKTTAVVTITEALRLNEANEIIPVIIKLRLLLKKQKSNCMNSLMLYMCELMKNFKNEMADLLNGDMDLKAEIEYNLRRIEVEEEERKRGEAAAEIVETNESRNEEENRNLAVLTTSPEEICEQLQNLIVQLSRCDSAEEKDKSVHPVVKLTKCDLLMPRATCSQDDVGTGEKRYNTETDEPIDVVNSELEDEYEREENRVKTKKIDVAIVPEKENAIEVGEKTDRNKNGKEKRAMPRKETRSSNELVERMETTDDETEEETTVKENAKRRAELRNEEKETNTEQPSDTKDSQAENEEIESDTRKKKSQTDARRKDGKSKNKENEDHAGSRTKGTSKKQTTEKVTPKKNTSNKQTPPKVTLRIDKRMETADGKESDEETTPQENAKWGVEPRREEKETNSERRRETINSQEESEETESDTQGRKSQTEVRRKGKSKNKEKASWTGSGIKEAPRKQTSEKQMLEKETPNKITSTKQSPQKVTLRKEIPIKHDKRKINKDKERNDKSELTKRNKKEKKKPSNLGKEEWSENEPAENVPEVYDEPQENEWMENSVEVDDDPIEEGEEKFSSDEN